MHSVNQKINSIFSRVIKNTSIVTVGRVVNALCSFAYIPWTTESLGLILKKGGVLGFDDYLWSEPLSYGIDPIRCPKLAIDVFTNIYCRKLKILRDYSKLTSLWQLYVEKLED